MGSFVISQQPNNKNAYLYPSGDLTGCTEHVAVGDNPNYLCVDDDRNNPDFSDTYVYNGTINEYKDLYETDNLPSDVDTVNSVQIFVRARITEAPSPDIDYRIIVSPDSVCTHVYNSDNKYLATAWRKMYYTWSDNPATGNSWTESEVNAMSIGFKDTSDSQTPVLTETLRPNGDGVKQWSSYPFINGYQCVDESTPNEDTDYIYTQDNNDIYLAALEDTSGAGTISKVVLFYRVKLQGGVQSVNLKPTARVNGTDYYGDEITVNHASWITYSYTWELNPDTSAVWNWVEVDALQAGLTTTSALTSDVLRCTQIYVIVYYTTTSVPEIQTSQCYAKVNYTPEVSTCTLEKPEEISTDHNRNINIINFWDGDRAVYDISRSRKTMVLQGKAFRTLEGRTPCEQIECLRTMGEDGSLVTVSGLSQDIWNGTFRILSVGWKKYFDSPPTFDYYIELEDNSNEWY